MLRSISISNRSGFVLFSADFEGSSKHVHSISGLFTALNDISKRSIGAPVSFIMMNKLAITVVYSEETGIKVILFHDSEYYRILAHCIAQEILRTFLEKFSPTTFNVSNNSTFKHFNSALGPAIRNSSSILLLSLIDRLRGAVQFSVVFSNGDSIFTYPSNANSLSVAANLQALQFSLQEMANLTSDTPDELIIEAGQVFSHVILFGTTTVVLQIRADFHSSTVISEVTETLNMLRLCFQTAEGLMA